MLIPNRPRHSVITRVSSLSSAPSSLLVPLANAAQTKARFVMLFDPGGRMRPQTGALAGAIVMAGISGKASSDLFLLRNLPQMPFAPQIERSARCGGRAEERFPERCGVN